VSAKRKLDWLCIIDVGFYPEEMADQIAGQIAGQTNRFELRLINQTSFYILLSLFLCVGCYGVNTDPTPMPTPLPTATQLVIVRATLTSTPMPTTTSSATATPLATVTATPTAEPVGEEPVAEIRSAGRMPSRQTKPLSPLATPAPTVISTQNRRLTLDTNATPTVVFMDSVATEDTNTHTAKPLSNTTNILLLGSDRRTELTSWRTDAIMVIALDLEGQAAGVISIPRDLYLDQIPLTDVGANRINVVDYLGEQDHAGGGPEALAQIIDTYMDIPIHYYLRFEFESFQKAIDILDGIEIEIDCAGSYYVASETEDEEDWILELPSGVHRLSGREALAYVRNRDVLTGDLDRARRQQRLAWAVRNQVLRENLFPRIPALYAILASSIQTDIGIAETVKFTRFALELDTQSIHGLVIAPPDLLREGMREEMFVFLPDWDAISETVQTIFERPPFEQTNTIGIDNENGRCP